MEQISDSEASIAQPPRDGVIGRPPWWTSAHVVLVMLPLLDLVTLFLLAGQRWDSAASTVFTFVVVTHALLAWWVFRSRVGREASREADLVKRYRDLQSAIEDGNLVLHYQPEVSLDDESVHAVEALVRWRQPDGQLIPPLDFIPFARSPA